MKNILPKVYASFFIVLIIFFPFQALLSNFLEFNTSLSAGTVFWLTHWYEPVILLFFVVAILSKIVEKEKYRFTHSQIFALLLLVLGVISIIFFSSSIGRGFEGFRFTLFGLLFYLFAFEAGIDGERVKKMVNIYLFMSAFVAIWALLERLLPYNYWGLWHIVNPSNVFGYGWHNVAFVKQSASILGGPNQMASYLLPAFFISFMRMIKFSKDNTRMARYYLGFCILLNLAIFLSFSRSAILGFGVALIACSIMLKNKWSTRYSALLIVLLFVSLAVIFISKGNALELITHGRSQSEHASALSASFSEIKSRIPHPVTLLLGAGLGSAGPLALKYGDGIISESWYLQLILEIGAIGLLLWLGFIIYASKELRGQKEFGLTLGLAAVSTTAIFLHTFADNPALTYTLFILIALKINSGKNYV